MDYLMTNEQRLHQQLCLSYFKSFTFSNAARKRQNIPMTKRRLLLLTLTITPLLILFVMARQAASWRPRALTASEFAAQQAPAFAFVDWEEDAALTPAQLQTKRRLVSKNWQPRALSPDGAQILAECMDCEGFALLDPKSAQLIHRLKPRKNSFSGEWRDAQFSSDGRYVEFSHFESTPPQVFDARTGQWLWDADYWNAKFAFSPDGTLAAHTNGQEDAILVRETATGREIKRVPYAYNETKIGFSRDSNFLLAEVAPRKFQRWRLR